jgi:hypothetical protein
LRLARTDCISKTMPLTGAVESRTGFVEATNRSSIYPKANCAPQNKQTGGSLEHICIEVAEGSPENMIDSIVNDPELAKASRGGSRAAERLTQSNHTISGFWPVALLVTSLRTDVLKTNPQRQYKLLIRHRTTLRDCPV